MPGDTPTQRLADVLLSGGLEDFVRSRRPERAWRLIARDLHEAVGIDVTYETIRGWYPDLPDRPADTPPLTRTG